MKAQRKPVVLERTSELLREAGALWLVFSVLDRYVGGSITGSWVMSNVVAALAVWGIGVYIETRFS
jgi:hypothetical protein